MMYATKTRSNNFSCSSCLKKSISSRYSTTSCCFDGMLHNTPKDWTLSASNPYCLHLLHNIVVGISSSICNICPQEVANSSFSVHCPLSFMLTLLLVRSWMLQDTDHMEACCIIYIQVAMWDQLEQNKICVLTVTMC